MARLLAGVALMALGASAIVGVNVITQSTAGAAVSITVNDASDGAPSTANCLSGSGSCTLRAAILAANASASDATITVPDANTVPNNASVTHTYTVLDSTGEIDFSDSGHTITLNGAGASLAIVQMTGGSITHRVFLVALGTTADISGISVENGHVAVNGGGGILNDGTLNLSNSTVSQNSAQFGGGIYLNTGGTLTNDTIDSNSATLNSGIAEAAGVFVSHGTNTITGGSISSNTSAGDTGGLYIQNSNPGDSTTISGVTINSNTAATGTGGVYVQNDGSSPTAVTLTNDTIDSNTSHGAAGGLYLQNDGTGNTVSVTGSFIDSNTDVTGDAGGVYVQNSGTNDSVTFNSVTINGNSSNSDSGGMYVQNDGTNDKLTVTGGSIDENSANLSGTNGFGGGVFIQNDFGTNNSDSFTGTDISANAGYEGGGVFVEGGNNTLSQDTISGNLATEAGGGISFDTGQNGSTRVIASTISQNDVGGLVGISAVLGDGGGIMSETCNAISLTNDTITANRSLNGGGYFGSSCAELPTVSTAFQFDTVSGNVATGGTGVGNVQTIDDSTLTFAQTIIANGSAASGPATNCQFTGPGSVTSLGYNMIDNADHCGTAGPGDIIGQNPQLGALANNGGPTRTELPASGSHAIGGVPANVCAATGVATDQRGVARGAGGSNCTIGAVEVPSANPNGYRLVANEGGIFDFGLNFNGSLANNHLNAPIVGIANSPGINGYVMAGGDGGVFALGGANFFGSLGGQAIPSPIAAIAAPPNESGYWLVAQNGKIYNYGSVPAIPAIQLPAGAHIVGMASTTDGQGAWLVDQLGDVYAEGSAHYVGGLGGVHINKPIIGIAAAAVGQGYVLVATDGGTFAYGTQHFFGSVPGSLKPGQNLNAPVVGIAVTHSGNGYWEVGADGGVFNYGDAPFLGSMGGIRLNGPVVGIQHLGSVSTPT
jgi:CSLREA domain-containing protein